MAAVSARKPIAAFNAWVGLWAVAVLVVWVACLVPPPPLPALPSGADKWQHALAYFLLAGSGVQLWQGRRALLGLGSGLLLMGIAIELAQGALSAQRQADAADVLANTLGLLPGLSLAATPLGNVLLRRFPASR